MVTRKRQAEARAPGAQSAPRGRRLRQVLRWAARLLGVAALALCVALLSLFLPPVRAGLLAAGLRLADRALPGELRVCGASWPHPGTILLTDVTWTTPQPVGTAGDTVLAASSLGVTVDVGGLRRGVVVVRDLDLRIERFDAPALAAMLAPPAGSEPADDEGPGGGHGFLAEGSVPGWPALSLQRAHVAVAQAVAAPGVEIHDLDLVAAADVAGAEPFLRAGPARAVVAVPADSMRCSMAACELALRWDPRRSVATLDTLALRIDALGTPALWSRWAGQPPLVVQGGGHARQAGGGAEGSVRLRLSGPGAPMLGAAWPAVLEPSTYSPLTVDCTVSGALADSVVDVRVSAAVEPVGLLGGLAVKGRLQGPLGAPQDWAAVVDSLVVRTPGLDLAGAGSLRDGGLDAQVRCSVRSPLPLVEAFAPDVAEAVVDGRADVRISGRPDAPRVALDLRADAEARQVRVRDLRLRADGGFDRLAVALDAGAIDVGERALADSLHLEVEVGAGGEDLRAATAVDAGVRLAFGGGEARTRGDVRLRVRGDPRDPLRGNLDIDALDVAAPGLILFAEGRADTGAGDVRLKVGLQSPNVLLESVAPLLAGADYGLELSAAIAGDRRRPRGRIEVAGGVEAGTFAAPRFVLQAEGDAKDFDLAAVAGGGLVWDGQVLADTLAVRTRWSGAAADSLPLTLDVHARRGAMALGLRGRTGPRAVTILHCDSLGLDLAGLGLTLQDPATVVVDTAARRVQVQRLAMAGSAGRVDLSADLAPEAARFAADLDLLLPEDVLQATAPAEFWSRDGGLDLAVTGRTRLEATPDTTVFEGGATVVLRPHRDATDVGARAAFRLAGPGRPGLEADVAIVAGDTVLLRASALWPGAYDRQLRRWVQPREGMLLVEAPRQTVVSALLRRLLPADTSVRGDVTVGLKAALPVSAADDAGEAGPDGGRAAGGMLDGTIAAPRLQIGLPGSSRLEVTADCRIEGTPADPRLAGEVTIASGFLRIPELPRGLHPTEGEPALWAMAADDSLGAQNGGATAAWSAGGGPPAAPAAPLPDLDLSVKVPGNLRIHGYGLDVEVAADVRVKRGQDARGRPGPALHGEAHAVHGTQKFMNRTFEIRKADIAFSGSVPPDPHLDILLETNITGTVVRLNVTGRASDPRIDLTSDPTMVGADIVAFLLFGRPLNDLDDDQRGRSREEVDPAQQFRENLAGLALVFGTAGLQNSVSGTIGVDIVEVGADNDGNSMLSAGKYISPRMLLKYSASLEKAGSYLVSVDYAISRMFRLVTTYGEGDEASGLELKWILRY